MQNAIILAAGVGKRLENVSEQLPKSLLEFNGKTLLERHLDNLLEFGVSEIIVVSGYKSELIKKAISESDSHQITRVIHNPEYKKGSLLSLLTGLNQRRSESDFILMDADVLYDKKILKKLFTTTYNNCFLLDKDFIPGDEPVKLCVRDGKLVEFRKQIKPGISFDFQGESVGFFRFTAEIANKIIKQSNIYIEQGNDEAPYEEILRNLLLEDQDKFGYEDITGLPWVEIDFPEDVIRASTEILPLIDN